MNISVPLATRLRPKNLGEFVGQSHLVSQNSPIYQMIQSGNLSSMIFWGPPATGKTTLAKIISNATKAEFYELSAVMDGKEQLKKVIESAKHDQSYNKQSILFVDEIHRWNKAQQDALLPFVESGQVILIGATTENPSFEITAPLLSRSRVFVFESHSTADIYKVLERGLNVLKNTTENNINNTLTKSEIDSLEALSQVSNGDLRFALNSLEIVFGMLFNNSNEPNTDSLVISPEFVYSVIQKQLRYDKNGEEHYNIISAVHKSLRSNNASAATYWVLRMIQAGEDPLYIARRLVRFASEDIGNAAPNALVLANATYDTCHKLGSPECEVALVQLVEYLARAPKNNSAYVAYQRAKSDILKYGNLPVPLHFRNAPTKLMKDLGYGKNYQYDPDLVTKQSNQECFPEQLKGTNYFS